MVSYAGEISFSVKKTSPTLEEIKEWFDINNLKLSITIIEVKLKLRWWGDLVNGVVRLLGVFPNTLNLQNRSCSVLQTTDM